MNGRVAKRLRRERPAKPKTELYASWGPNRRRRRSKVVDRGYTATGEQVVMIDNGGGIHYKKTAHVVNDYTEQREQTKPPANLSNYVRNQYRKAYRQAIRKEAENAKGTSN